MLQRWRAKETLRCVRGAVTHALSTRQDAAELDELVSRLDTLRHPTELSRALQLCARLRSQFHGSAIHARITGIDVSSRDHLFLANHTINMYGKCRDADRARIVFESLAAAKNIFSWTSMLGAYHESDRIDEAFELFGLMLLQGDPRPDEVTMVIMLNACRGGCQAAFVLDCVNSNGLESNPIVANAAVTMLGRCGDLDRAWMFFQGVAIEERNVVSWTGMVTAFARLGHPLHALKLCQEMQLQGVRPNFYTLSALVNSCGHCHDLSQLLCIHGAIAADSVDVTNLFVGNALISAYAKLGSVEEARVVFDQMLEKDSISWNAMISGYADWNDHLQALDLYRRLQLEGHRPTSIALVAAMESCSRVDEVAVVHSGICESGLESSTVVGTTVVAAYGRLGDVDAARRAFAGIRRTDSVAWNALLAAYSYTGTETLRIFWNMMLHGAKPVTVLTFLPVVNSIQDDGVATNAVLRHLLELIEVSGCGREEMLCASVISMLARLGKLEQGQSFFEKNIDASPRPAAWNAVIAANALHQNGQESVRIFRRMLLQGVRTDKTSFLSAASALSSIGRHEKTMLQLEAMATSSGFGSDEVVKTGLIAMFGKTGNLDDAWRVFSDQQQGNVCWNSIVSVLAQHGHLDRSFHLVRKMQQEGRKPDEITLSTVLAACSHSGSIDEAQNCFVSMVSDFGLKPISQHYSCMIDALGRAGRMERLKSFLRSCSGIAEMDVVAWTALLTACWNHKDVELAMLACDRVLEMSPKQSSALVMLHNTHTNNDK